MEKKMMAGLIVALIAIIAIVIGAGMISGMIANVSYGTPDITSDTQAKSTVTDVGTDVSGISNTLSEIDQTLSGS